MISANFILPPTLKKVFNGIFNYMSEEQKLLIKRLARLTGWDRMLYFPYFSFSHVLLNLVLAKYFKANLCSSILLMGQCWLEMWLLLLYQIILGNILVMYEYIILVYIYTSILYATAYSSCPTLYAIIVPLYWCNWLYF